MQENSINYMKFTKLSINKYFQTQTVFQCADKGWHTFKRTSQSQVGTKKENLSSI